MLSNDSIELLFQLSNAHAVPGSEDEIRDIFKEKTEGTGDISIDKIGNFYCKRSQSNRPHIAVDCHMDEVGFMVQSITPEGFLRVIGLGGWSISNIPAQPVVVIGKIGKVPGIFGSIPPHFSKSSENATPGIESMYVDIGAGSAKAVKDWGIRPGTPICPDIRARGTFNPMRIMGKAFDNRVGCGVCLETAMSTQDLKANVTYIGAVQEEGGLRGAEISSRIAAPDLAIVLEGTPADDTPGILSSESQGVLGKGVQIRFYDPTHLANSKLADWVVDLAEEHDITHQIAVRRTGGTNAGKYHLAGSGVPTVVLGVPSRYIHSHQSMIDLNDYEATCLLTKKIVEKMDKSAYASILPK